MHGWREVNHNLSSYGQFVCKGVKWKWSGKGGNGQNFHIMRVWMVCLYQSSGKKNNLIFNRPLTSSLIFPLNKNWIEKEMEAEAMLWISFRSEFGKIRNGTPPTKDSGPISYPFRPV